MNLKVLGWEEYAQGNPGIQCDLIDWKLSRFKTVGWGGTNVDKYGGTGNARIQLNDQAVPFGCLALCEGRLAGCGFLGRNDLLDYPIDLSIPYTGQPIKAEQANPWLIGLFVDKAFRQQGLARKIEEWIVQQAGRLVQAGAWPFPHRRLWLCTERLPLDFLPAMYERWGWTTHRSFMHNGQQVWVMYKDF